MNHVRKLALHGMRGRRKDTRVLALVIVMSFLFLTAGTLLLSSFSGSQARQRQSLYGGWHLLYGGGGDSRVAESLTGLSQVAETAEVVFFGVTAGVRPGGQPGARTLPGWEAFRLSWRAAPRRQRERFSWSGASWACFRRKPGWETRSPSPWSII